MFHLSFKTGHLTDRAAGAGTPRSQARPRAFAANVLSNVQITGLSSPSKPFWGALGLTDESPRLSGFGAMSTPGSLKVDGSPLRSPGTIVL